MALYVSEPPPHPRSVATEVLNGLVTVGERHLLTPFHLTFYICLPFFWVKKNLLPVFSRCICMFSLHSSELMGQLVPSALGPSAIQLTPSLVALRVSASTDSNGPLLHGRTASSGTSAACPGALWRRSPIPLDQPQIFAAAFLHLCCFRVTIQSIFSQSLSITSSSKQHFSLAVKKSSNHS